MSQDDKTEEPIVKKKGLFGRIFNARSKTLRSEKRGLSDPVSIDETDIFEIPLIDSTSVDTVPGNFPANESPSEDIQKNCERKSSRAQIIEEPTLVANEKAVDSIIQQKPIVKSGVFDYLKKVITTRSVDEKTLTVDKKNLARVFSDRITSHDELPDISHVKRKRSYVERKFAPKGTTSEKPRLDDGAVLKDENLIIVDDCRFPPEAVPQETVDAVKRTKPLPNVKMVPKRTLIWKIKRKWPFSLLYEWVRGKKRTISTGLTPRQRIKRYNSIHEGGYGSPPASAHIDTIGEGNGVAIAKTEN